MDKKELREKLLKLDKKSIIAGFSATCYFSPEVVYREALIIEREAEEEKRQAAVRKGQEHAELAQKRAIEGKLGGAEAAFRASNAAYNKARKHSSRGSRLHDEIMATYED